MILAPSKLERALTVLGGEIEHIKRALDASEAQAYQLRQQLNAAMGVLEEIQEDLAEERWKQRDAA